MIENVIRTDFLFISIVFICCIAIQTNESLKCYSYRGNYTKTNFNRSKNEIIYGNDMYDVCSVCRNIYSDKCVYITYFYVIKTS